MGRRRTKGEAARRHIVAAAADLFAERGFYGASVRQLAEAAGVPPASLLHHFPSKEELYAAVLVRVTDDLGARVAPALEGAGDYPARLRRFVRRVVIWMEETPGHLRLLLRELLDNPERLAARPVSFQLAPPMRWLVDFIRAGQRAGELASGDPHFFVVHFFGSCSFYVAAKPSLRHLVSDARVLSRARLERELLRLAERLLLP